MQPAAAESEAHGLPALPLSVVPHPMAKLGDEAVRALAREVYPQIKAALASAPSQSLGRVGSDIAVPLAAGELASVDDAIDDVEGLFDFGWSDGLPVVPPTKQRVNDMLKAAPECAARRLGPFPPGMRNTTIDKIAANAVMAGCLPKYFPVVLTALDALLDENSGLSSSQTATNTSAPLLVVNGPVVQRIGLNGKYNCLGSGSRPNATIGRAVRLVLRNVGGEVSGLTDMATHGQPGKFTYCFAENQEESPWPLWHTTRGIAPGISAVSVVMASPPQNIFAYGCNTADSLIDHLVGAVTGLGHNNIMFATGPMLILSPEHAQLLASEGIDRTRLQARIFDAARIPLDRFTPEALRGLLTRRANWFATVPDKESIGVADSPQDVHVLVAGGPGIHTQFVSTAFSSFPITRQIPA